jgi:aerobic carbon-monoxide dehydrogenase large subunit
MGYVGQSVRRLEDVRLLRGAARFVDDVDLPGQLHLVVVRSQEAHGTLRTIDVSEARALPGVHAVWTGANIATLPRIPLRLQLTDDGFGDVLQPLLAIGKVRYVGEPVAVVVAEDPYLAEDAAEVVDVDITPLPVVLDAHDRDQPGLIHDRGNEVTTLTMGYGDVPGAQRDAAHVVELDAQMGRHTAVPLETRGAMAAWDVACEHVTIYGMTKVPHFNRRVLADMLAVPVTHIHTRSTDAGGGFGVRGEFYPEDALVPLLARELRRPVKWVEDRAEHLVACNHSRQQRHRIVVTFDEDLRITSLSDEVWHDNGAYLRTHGVTVPELTATMLPGPYRIPSYHVDVHVVTTNKTPCGTYRAPGRYEGTFAREAAFDKAARELGVSPLELRHRNLLTPDELPHTRPLSALGTSMVLDESDYPRLLVRALSESGFAEWEREAADARRQGRLVGAGMACVLEKSGLGPYETAAVELHVDGVHVHSGGASVGQGIETVLAQIAADALGADYDSIHVVHGDSDVVPDGVGSWASRSTVVGGSAVLQAATDLRAKITSAAAMLHGVPPGEIVVSGGVVHVGEVAMTLPELARVCGEDPRLRHEFGLVLRGDAVFTVDNMTYPAAVHLAQVEVDAATGVTSVLHYHVAVDVGRAINPKLIRGQVLGGIAQGLGGALLEEFTYTPEGQPQTTTFMDYLLPSAAEMPARVGVTISEDSPARGNPLGARGAGEGGVTGVGAAIANAVMDATGLTIDTLPLSPARVRYLLRQGRS